MEDKSIIKNTDTVDVNATYINDCIKEVCLKGDSLTKYKRMIEKQYDAEFYQKCGNFVKEVKHSVNRKKFTQTSIANLNHLANEINVTSATIETLIDYYTKKFADDEKEERKTVRKSQKRVKEEKNIEEETALMKKVAWAEHKRLEIEIEEERKKEEEKKRKAKEHRKKAEEHRCQKEQEEEIEDLFEEKKETEGDKDDKKFAIGCGIIIAVFIMIRIFWVDAAATFILILLVLAVASYFFKQIYDFFKCF